MKLNPKDQVSIKYSPFIWTVIKAWDTDVKCRNSNGSVITFTHADVLDVVQRATRY